MSSGTAQENAGPSRLSDDEFSLPRILGLIGMGLALLGSLTMFISIARGFSPRLIYLGLVGVGLVFMLYHSARDADPQVSRSYGLFGAALLLMGGLFALLPGGEGEARTMGYRFLSLGFPSLVIGFLFLLSALRHERNDDYRTYGQLVLLGLGVAFSLAVMFAGVINPDFMIDTGALLSVFGLTLLCSYIAQVGAATGRGYQVSWGIGILGAVAVLYAIGRATLSTAFTESGPFLVPVGLIYVGLGLLYGLTAICMLSDVQVVLIFRRELTAFFYSPIAYLVIFGMAMVGWLNYFLFLQVLYGSATRGVPSIEEPVLRYYMSGQLYLPGLAAVFVVPAITMALFSEERRRGTLEVMMTAPVSEWAVVLGKFFATLVFFVLLWVPWGLYLIALRSETGAPMDYRPMLSFYLALTLTGASLVAMGQFFSSLTRNQIVAAVLTFAGMVVYYLIWLLTNQASGLIPASWEKVLEPIAFLNIWGDSLAGRLPLRDVILHVSAAFFWLFLTNKVLEARKWS